jgi:hypothetical protein
MLSGLVTSPNGASTDRGEPAGAVRTAPAGNDQLGVQLGVMTTFSAELAAAFLNTS